MLMNLCFHRVMYQVVAAFLDGTYRWTLDNVALIDPIKKAANFCIADLLGTPYSIFALFWNLARCNE